MTFSEIQTTKRAFVPLQYGGTCRALAHAWRAGTSGTDFETKVASQETCPSLCQVAGCLLPFLAGPGHTRGSTRTPSEERRSQPVKLKFSNLGQDGGAAERHMVHPRDADAWRTAFVHVEGGGLGQLVSLSM